MVLLCPRSAGSTVRPECSYSAQLPDVAVPPVSCCNGGIPCATGAGWQLSSCSVLSFNSAEVACSCHSRGSSRPSGCAGASLGAVHCGTMPVPAACFSDGTPNKRAGLASWTSSCLIHVLAPGLRQRWRKSISCLLQDAHWLNAMIPRPADIHQTSGAQEMPACGMERPPALLRTGCTACG